MTESLPCAVCGYPVPLDMDHRRVTDKKVSTRDRDDQDDYYLHERCADAVFDGWRTP